MASLNYQLVNTNESGQEVVRHLQDTAQDPSVVIDKVDGINNQWDQLQTKLLELRNRVEHKVSPKNASRFTLHASRSMLGTSRVTDHTSHFTPSHYIVYPVGMGESESCSVG